MHYSGTEARQKGGGVTPPPTNFFYGYAFTK